MPWQENNKWLISKTKNDNEQDLFLYITEMCNGSLEVGRMPLSQRHAIVQPRLKKATANPEDMKNYRPISNLTFISQSYGETSLLANFCLSGRKQTATNNAVCIPMLPFDRKSSAENCLRHTSCSRSWRCYFSLPLGSVRRV